MRIVGGGHSDKRFGAEGGLETGRAVLQWADSLLRILSTSDAFKNSVLLHCLASFAADQHSTRPLEPGGKPLSAVGVLLQQPLCTHTCPDLPCCVITRIVIGAHALLAMTIKLQPCSYCCGGAVSSSHMCRSICRHTAACADLAGLWP